MQYVVVARAEAEARAAEKYTRARLRRVRAYAIALVCILFFAVWGNPPCKKYSPLAGVLLFHDRSLLTN